MLSPVLSLVTLGTLYQVSGLLQKDRAYYLDTLGKTIAVAETPYPERYALNANAARAFKPPAQVLIVSRMLLPDLAPIVARDADNTARLRTAVTAMAVERFRRAHGGALPENLEALVPACIPALPADPYTGKPLHFTRDGTAYAVYSVGPNLKDDGVNWKSARLKNSLDVAFLVQHEGWSKR